MIVTYHGGHCVKFAQGDVSVVVNPHDKTSSYGGVRFGTDIALVSLHHPDFEGVEGLSYGNKVPFIINSPGEYEVGQMSIMGYGSPIKYEQVDRFNTIYQIRFDGFNIVVLGAIVSSDISPKILGEFGEIDMLVVPISGGELLDVPEAVKLATKLEPHVIIPVAYNKKSIEVFQKELESSVKPVEKLTVKLKEVHAMDGELVILSA